MNPQAQPDSPFLAEGFLHGFGVRLSESGPRLPDEPVSQSEAEDLRDFFSATHPSVEVVQMSLAADLSLAAHVPSEDDRFGYHFFAKAYGRPERHTSFVPMTYGDALTRVEELRESGYVGVELYLLTDI